MDELEECTICHQKSDQMLMLTCVHDPCIECALTRYAREPKGRRNVKMFGVRRTPARYADRPRPSTLAASSSLNACCHRAERFIDPHADPTRYPQPQQAQTADICTPLAPGGRFLGVGASRAHAGEVRGLDAGYGPLRGLFRRR